MSILIKGMTMPIACCDCPFCMVNRWDKTNCICDLSKSKIEPRLKSKDCPIIELKPHGRLIDADAFEKNIWKHICKDCEHRKGMKNGKKQIIYQIGDAPCRACYIDDMFGYVDDAPTIIEAEESKDER